jgi:hypothetical protein
MPEMLFVGGSKDGLRMEVRWDQPWVEFTAMWEDAGVGERALLTTKDLITAAPRLRIEHYVRRTVFLSQTRDVEVFALANTSMEQIVRMLVAGYQAPLRVNVKTDLTVEVRDNEYIDRGISFKFFNAIFWRITRELNKPDKVLVGVDNVSKEYL